MDLPVERYFEIQGIKTKTNSRQPLFAWKVRPYPGIVGLKLERRFDHGQVSNKNCWIVFKLRRRVAYEQFLNIQQESTVQDYVYKFEKLAGQLIDLLEKVL